MNNKLNKINLKLKIHLFIRLYNLYNSIIEKTNSSIKSIPY